VFPGSSPDSFLLPGGIPCPGAAGAITRTIVCKTPGVPGAPPGGDPPVNFLDKKIYLRG